MAAQLAQNLENEELPRCHNFKLIIVQVIVHNFASQIKIFILKILFCSNDIMQSI